MSATPRAIKTFRSSNSEANTKRTSYVLFVLRYNNRSGRTLATTRASLETRLCSVRLNTISSPAPSCRCQFNVAAMPWLPPLSGEKGRHFYIKQSEFKPVMLIAKFMMCLLENIIMTMVTQMLLLCFQTCAVVNRVVILHLRHRRGKSRMPRVVTITDEPNLSASRINSRIRWRHHDRLSIRIETRHRQNPLLFSVFATATANPECRVS